MPIIGRVVKLVSGGIGLASEAIEDHKQKKAIKSQTDAQGRGSDVAESSSSAATRPITYGPPDGDEPPPEYVETSEEHAQELIASGRAVPVSQSELDTHGHPLDKKKHSGTKTAEDDDDSDDEDDRSDIDDEAEWALDDAAEAADPPSYEEVTRQVSDNQLIDQVLRLAGASPAKCRGISAPVILPQRRPQDKGRGFVRAYSPVLEEVGISQDCFLTFTRNWHTASQASPWLNVIMLGTFAVGFVPEMWAQISTAVVQVAVGTAQEIQRRHRTNTFLDAMNEQLFKPRGLYAMVFTYKPEATRPIDAQQLNINEVIARYSSHDSGRMKETMKDLRTSSGTTYGQLEIPHAAPLVFPALDEAAFGGDAKKQNALKGTGKFMADYLDRRAQARYVSVQRNSATILIENSPFVDAAKSRLIV